MLENQLKQLGFSKNETKVYLALFDLGKCRAGQIIENIGLHRNLVYTALDELVSKGLVSKVLKNGVATFSANSPDLLLSMVEEQKNIAQDAVAELKKKGGKDIRDIVVYEGDEGVKRSRNRALQYDAGDTLYVIGSKSSSTPEMEKFWRQFHAKREKQGINFKMMYEKGSAPADLSPRNNLKLSEEKYLPMQIDFPVWFSFIKDYLEIGIPGDNPLTFGLRSKEAVGAFKQFFNYFWNQEVIVENGYDALERNVYNMLNELNSGEEYYVLGASVGTGNERVQKMYDRYHADRIKKGVVVYMLAYKEGFKKIMDRFHYSGDPDMKVSHAKSFLSAPPIPMQINIFKNKTYFIVYGEEPSVIIFSRPEVAQVFKNYFDTQWNQESITFVGKERVEEGYNSLLALANKEEEVVIFAAKPNDPESSKFNLHWAKQMSVLCKKIKYIYYGETPDNIERANEIRKNVPNSEVKIIQNSQSLPISNIVINDVALNTVWTPTPVCMITKNKTVADSLRENFNLLWNQESQILKGARALCELWLEAIECKELRQIGARGYFIDYFPELFEEIKKKALGTPGVKWRNVVDPGVRGHAITKLPWAETRYNLPNVRSPIAIWMFGEKVLVINWAQKEPIIFCSTNKVLVQSYNDYFEELWTRKN